MNEVWVTNASPIITLAKIGRLDLLTRLSNELLVPYAVAQEVLAGPASDPARQAIESGWGQHLAPASIAPELLEWGLDAGETAAIALAQERLPCTVLLDDQAARTCARTLHVPTLGTLGIVLRARQRGLVPSAAEVIRALRTAGLHLDDRTIRLALDHVGETW